LIGFKWDAASDWVQAGRYAAGLDPLTILGGPTEESEPEGGFAAASELERRLYMANSTIVQGQTNAFSVALDCQGNENAVSFSVKFDPAALNFLSASAGQATTGSLINFNTADVLQGRLGIALAAQPGRTFAAGTREIVKIQFSAVATAPATTKISFGGSPVPNEISDASANPLPTSFPEATVSIVRPPGPVMNLTRSGNSMVITWPASATGFVLESNESVRGMNWTVVAGTIEIGDQKAAVISMDSSARYFRLRKND
jgi:hypothetical protein